MQWSLNSRLGHRIWETIYSPCSGIMEKLEPNDPSLTAANVIYYVLLSIDVQQEFQKVGLKNHAVISSEYVKFLATNTGYDSVDKMSARLLKLETAGQDLTMKLKEANASAKTASTTSADLKRKVDALERKLQQRG